MFTFIGTDMFWQMWAENLIFALCFAAMVLVGRLVYLFFKEK
jgi:hypothetical protein